MQAERVGSRDAAMEMSAEQFRELGHDLVERIGAFLGSIRDVPVTRAEPPQAIRAALDAGRALPGEGGDAQQLLRRAAALLFEHSLFSAHPRFYGYVVSSAAPIGILGEFLAAAVNPNVGAWKLSPMAT